MPDWVEHGRQYLFSFGHADRGWGYQPGAALSVEPTVLSCLAIAATDPGRKDPRTADALQFFARSLAVFQKPDGAVGVGAGIPAGVQQPAWPTAYAVLLWAAYGRYEAQRARAVEWLLKLKGEAYAHDDGSPVGHDTTLVGWPWVAGTHSWLEPTAMAILALRREGHAAHDRVAEGLKLMADRAVPTGGWNYGNSSVFGNTLRAQPAPTGLSLLALAGLASENDVVDKASDYLLKSLPHTRAPQSLAWGIMGLLAWNRRPAEAAEWLQDAYSLQLERRQAPYLAALLLMASTPHSLNVLGVPFASTPQEAG
jgi:hypothetical protein